MLKDIFYFEQVRCLDHVASVGQLVKGRKHKLAFMCVERNINALHFLGNIPNINAQHYVVVQCVCRPTKIPFVLMKCRFAIDVLLLPISYFTKSNCIQNLNV